VKLGHAMVFLGLMALPISSWADTARPLAVGETPVPGSTEAELWYGMDQAEKEIRQSPFVIHDPALNAYVREVLCAVTKDYCTHIRLYIVDVPVFNASMSPNGVMLVFSGALLRLQDEAELAVLLGHEFAHYKQRHSLQQWESAKRTTAFLASFGVLTWAGGVGLVGGIAQMAGFANMMQFSRDSEREADRVGFGIIAEKGYDPQAGMRLWQRIQREEAAEPNYRKNRSAVFASHPKTLERIADMQSAAETYAGKSSERFQQRYAAAVQPFLFNWLDAELDKRSYNASIQVINERLPQASPAEIGMYEFYLGEAYRRRNSGDDRSKADAFYAQAVSRNEPPAAAFREHGLAMKRNGKNTEALSQLKLYLAQMPNASDRLFIEKDISELEKMK
jgi:beta-barrel assembly-enhancing protease